MGAPTSRDQPSVKRDWIDITVRLATSWVGLFTAYVIAVVLAIAKFKEFKNSLAETGLPLWGAVLLVASFPCLALIFSTIPALIEQRRIKRYSEVTGTLSTGYFTLRPREDEETFGRPDNAHEETLRWMESTTESILYLTGSSGTGKSSLLSAWVIPKLRRRGNVVIQLRGSEGNLLAAINEALLEPGIVWERPSAMSDDTGSILDRACQRLAQSDTNGRIFILVDQFEEFLILADSERQEAIRLLFTSRPSNCLTFVLIYRPEYEGFLEDQHWPPLRLDTNRRVIRPFTENAAYQFLQDSGLTLSTDLSRVVLREAAEIDQTVGLIRPVTANLCGLILGRFANGLPRGYRGSIIRGFLRESLRLPEVRDVAAKIIPQLITKNATKQPRTISFIAQATRLSPAAVRSGLRRLGESDRAIVRPLDQQHDTWEISHDFLVPLLDAIAARGIESKWRALRPWLPWAVAATLGIAATLVPFTVEDPTVELRRLGWVVAEQRGVLHLTLNRLPTANNLAPLGRLTAPLSLTFRHSGFVDLSPLGELQTIEAIDLSATGVTDLSRLKHLKTLKSIRLRGTKI